VRSTIPPARGLGSSAALALAAAAAAGAADPLAVAAAFDGHAENAAASLLGGLVAATTVDGRPLARRLPLDPELVYVLLVPARELSTSAARRALPAEVPFADATFELGRMGLLVAGLADRRQLVPEATDDRLHQERRAAALFPEAPVLLARLAEAGALGACWSGAGPSLLGIVERSKGASLRDAGEVALADLGVAGESVLLEADLEGLRVEPGEP
jgi:homoserine kinase